MVTTTLPRRPAAAGRPAAQLRPARYSAVIVTICVLTSAAALAWAYLLGLHGGYWRTGHRLPPGPAVSGPQPAITAVIPARNEAAMLPLCLPSLLGQDYPGTFAVILVDDDSTDGTAKVAAALGEEAGWRVTTAAPGDRQLAVVPA
jgi:cellulose synthase/poly-beta-1,6-N-acetylglucosamine synthase-like glycosyltransferase